MAEVLGMQPRTGSVEVRTGEGTFTFCLRIQELITLQEKRDAGPARLLERMRSQDWLVQDLFETIRLGLIGGGMLPMEALSLTEQLVRPGYLMELQPIALTVVFAALVGVPEDQVPSGEKKAPVRKKKAETPTPVA